MWIVNFPKGIEFEKLEIQMWEVVLSFNAKYCVILKNFCPALEDSALLISLKLNKICSYMIEFHWNLFVLEIVLWNLILHVFYLGLNRFGIVYFTLFAKKAAEKDSLKQLVKSN